MAVVNECEMHAFTRALRMPAAFSEFLVCTSVRAVMPYERVCRFRSARMRYS